jgi:MFS family permease
VTLVPAIVISWSLVTAFSGFEQSYGALVVCRLLMGVFESALFPSLNLYVAMFWKREEIASRASLIMVSLALAGAFGGLFAWAIEQMDGVGGYAGWRWLFFIEGMMSFVIGVAGFFLFPDSPETAYFLNKEERELARLRLEPYGVNEEFDWAQVKAALVSPVCWLSGFIQLTTDIVTYGKSTRVKLILHHQPADSQKEVRPFYRLLSME